MLSRRPNPGRPADRTPAQTVRSNWIVHDGLTDPVTHPGPPRGGRGRRGGGAPPGSGGGGARGPPRGGPRGAPGGPPPRPARRGPRGTGDRQRLVDGRPPVVGSGTDVAGEPVGEVH